MFYDIILRRETDEKFLFNNLEDETLYRNALKKLSTNILRNLKNRSWGNYQKDFFECVESIEIYPAQFLIAIYDEKGNFLNTKYERTKILSVYVYVTNDYLDTAPSMKTQKRLLFPIIDTLYFYNLGVISIQIDSVVKEAPSGYFITNYKSATLRTRPTISDLNPKSF